MSQETGSEAPRRADLTKLIRGEVCRRTPGVRLAPVLLCTLAPIACAVPAGGAAGGDGEPAATGATTTDIVTTGAASDATLATNSDTSVGASGPAADFAGAASMLLDGAAIAGRGLADVRVVGETIVEVGDLEPLPGETVVALGGKVLAPAFIDSHVHLLYLPNIANMARNGLAGVVDLAAPPAIFAADTEPLRTIVAGPMITAIGGYPTQDWGAGGYGLECADAAAAEAAVDMLHDLGAGVIKLPVTSGPQLDDAALAAAAARAHAYGLPVASHALADDEARRAALAGADVLAHTPISPLTAKTLDAWAGRAVISTLKAFGGGAAAASNLAALRERGAKVLYGTDYGNSAVPGIDRRELELLLAAGLTPAELLAAGTSAPAAYWGFDGLGAIEPGKDASLLVLESDPLQDPLVLAEPARVLVRGAWQP